MHNKKKNCQSEFSLILILHFSIEVGSSITILEIVVLTKRTLEYIYTIEWLNF